MEIELKNFMAHSHTKVDLGGSNSVAIVGDNGVGKSAFLESLPYAYFGQTRGSKKLQDRSRKMGDGSHEVRVTETLGGKQVQIRRGCNQSGKGFLYLYEEGEKVGQGKKAQEKIEELLGCDFPTYMMTAFYGLGKQVDTIMDVPPATRLETLQKFANVDVYKKFNETASKKLKNLQTTYENKKGRRDQIKDSIVDVKGLRSEKSEVSGKVSEIETDIEELTKRERDLSAKEEHYHNLRVERGKVANELENLESQIEYVDDDLAQVDHDLEAHHVVLEEVKEGHTKSKESLTGYKAASEYEDSVEKLQSQRRDYDVRISLREEALNQGVDNEETECPLCGAKLEDHTKGKWREEIELYKGKRDDLASEIAKVTGFIRERQRLEEDIGVYAERKKEILDAIKDSEAKKAEYTNSRSSLVSQKSSKQGELSTIDDKMAGGEDLRKEIDEVNDRLHDLNKQLARNQARVEEIDKRISEALESKRLLQEVEEEIGVIDADIEAYTILTEAFSRYGVPMELVRKLEESIEKRATAVFSEFSEGYISVRETTVKGNPGVEFYLVDRKGERTWDELSQGEQAMVFVSIRVAISQILGLSEVNFLILDEVASNLSPANRDNLIRLINKVLRKYFPSVLMVSHVPMLEVFDRSVTFKENSEGVPYVVDDVG